jgi:branched-chain amino acid transport system substrate-binding protein
MKKKFEQSALDHDPQRRQLLKIAGGLVLSSVIPASFARAQTSGTIKIGYVNPTTGPLAVFGEPDAFTLEQVRKAVSKGLSVGGKKYAVEIITKDSQSDPNRAADVASELILKDKVNLVLACATPETTNPVADQCELNGVPCITTIAPWQPYFFGRGGDPKKGFDWTYHFFFGADQLAGVYTSIWAKVRTNKTVGALWPNDTDGNAFAQIFPPVMKERGFKIIDRGRFQLPVDDFSAQIAEFKRNNVEIVTGVLPPPDFASFWTQAGQQGFKPKMTSMGKATPFPAAIAAIGPRAQNLSNEIWWSPAHPFRSSMTGQSSLALASAYSASTGRPWTMPLGFKHSLFEVALDALKRAGSLDPGDIRNAVKSTNLQTIVGPINFAKGPVPNVAVTPLVGGQWQKVGDKLDLVIIENAQAPNIGIQALAQLLK